MSGGSLNYFYTDLEEHAGNFGDKELDDLVRDLAKLFKKREWYLSSDIGVGSWREARDKFKEKWFTGHGRQERIEQYLKGFCDEVRQAFGIKQDYCRNCKHWTQQRDGEFGDCEYETRCLMHRCDSCEKYEEEE